MKSREIRLESRPVGWPTPANFSLAETELPPCGEGDVAVRNLYVSVDPYMRGRMNDVKSYVPPFALGAALQGSAIGEVVDSCAPGVPVGALVSSMYGWREAFVAPGKHVQVMPRDAADDPAAFLGVLGLTGLTAWAGLELLALKPGERLFVSAAAGAVGMIAGQLAKLRGCTVIGSAGSAEKVAMLTGELGFDAAFDYKAGDVRGQLERAAPQGIDGYFDNVGGDHLEAAIFAMRVNGRIAACGAIQNYNAEQPVPGPTNLSFLMGKRLTIRGFIVSDWFGKLPEVIAELAPLVRSGKLVAKQTVVEGIANAPQAFIDLLRGANIGKMIVKI